MQLDKTLLERLLANQSDQSLKSDYQQILQNLKKQSSSRNQNFEPILNIKTAKDINIYNNSFILPTGLNTSLSMHQLPPDAQHSSGQQSTGSLERVQQQ